MASWGDLVPQGFSPALRQSQGHKQSLCRDCSTESLLQDPAQYGALLQVWNKLRAPPEQALALNVDR